jgi:alkylation response protein AidB-like acyl-CoA dehydrogenase
MILRQRGAQFLYDEAEPAEVLTPEDQRPEQRQIAEAAREFVNRQVRPNLEKMEAQDWETVRQVIHQAGDVGLLGLEAAPVHGGPGLDKVTAMLVSREMGAGASFSVTYAVHSGIGMLPIVYFGTPEQKAQYLPALIRGEKVSAYSLTEPGSGSDALGAKTTARLSDDGRYYLLNGTKQWTSNAGFADVFVTFAKVDGEQFTAFIVERGYPGLSIGAEEKKMGLKGSSTAQVQLNDVPVPVENVLHHVGKGHQVAFNLLNLGRFNLAAGALGACTYLVGVSTRYAEERRQFGRPIATFPLIQQKLAGMATRTYALGALVFRIAGLLDEAGEGLDLADDARDASTRALAEFAIECSIAKVFGSEAVRDVADEGVQIHGGYGFMQGYDVERAYRDSRINRIFEGTNEIHRLLIPQTLLRRIQRGELPQPEQLRSAASDLASLAPPPADAAPLERERYLVRTTRTLFWLLSGLALRHYQANLEDAQETLSLLGDVAIELFAMESAVARARRASATAPADQANLHLAFAQAYAWPAFQRVVAWARQGIGHLAAGDDQARLLAAISRAAEVPPGDLIGLSRQIAAQVRAAEGYPLPD